VETTDNFKFNYLT